MYYKDILEWLCAWISIYKYSKRQSSFYFGVYCAGFWPRERHVSLQNPCASAGGFIVNDKIFLSFTIKQHRERGIFMRSAGVLWNKGCERSK